MARDIVSFSMRLAEKVGFENAGFLQDIAYWIDHNKSSDVNFVDGRYWSFSTQEQLCKRHPYWTRKQIQRIIKNCKENGWLLVENYNRSQYDRTNWYSLSDEIMDLIFGCNGTSNEVQSSDPNGAMSMSETGQSNNVNKNDNEECKQTIYRATLRKQKNQTPTLDEVIEYAESRGRVDLAEKFFDYYDAADWYDQSGNKVKNWKQKFITWEQRTPKPKEEEKPKKTWEWDGYYHEGMFDDPR